MVIKRKSPFESSLTRPTSPPVGQREEDAPGADARYVFGASSPALGPMVRLGWGAFSAHSLVTTAVRLRQSAADPSEISTSSPWNLGRFSIEVPLIP